MSLYTSLGKYANGHKAKEGPKSDRQKPARYGAFVFSLYQSYFFTIGFPLVFGCKFYPIRPRTDFPIIPSFGSNPKFSKMVAPITPKVSCSSMGPLPVKDGDQARNGTFSRV